MALAPGMMIDREDVGGNEGGQQPSYYGHGSASSDSTWNVDGANITDNSALGAAPAYLNVSNYEELQINYGNNSITSQTGGVQINLITKRGGNRYSGTFFMDAEDKAWQSTNLTAQLKPSGTRAPASTRSISTAPTSADLSSRTEPGSTGPTESRTSARSTLAGTNDNTWLASGYAKLDFQLGSSTRISGLFQHDNKLKFGRTNWGATLQAPETVWNQTGPTPMYKGEIEQMFGNLFLNGKIVYSHNTFHLAPSRGPRTAGRLRTLHAPPILPVRIP